MKRALLIGLLGLSAPAFLCGCLETQYTPIVPHATQPLAPPMAMTRITNQLDVALLRSPTNLFTLGPGDRLEIESLEDTNVVTTVVGPDGKVYFGLLPGLEVWGLTLGQATALMEHEMTKYVRGQPHISVTLREVGSQRVWLLGRFQAPGVYAMAAPMTLLEAISMAGGAMTFTGSRDVSGGPLGEELADLRHSFIVRHGKLLPVDFQRLMNRGDLSQNIYLQPDDFVYFAPAYSSEVYVLGAVTQPKPVPYTEGMTAAQAIAGAYGTIQDAYLNHVCILRGSLAEPEIAVVNFKDVMAGRTVDIPLEPHDIVYVPFSPYRYLRKYAEIALDTFVSSMAINAGSHVLAPRNAVGAGVFIPVGSGVQILPPPTPPIH